MQSMYCIDPNSDEPIMLLNRHIGIDAEDGMGIDGALFQQELLQLDTMGKKRIQVWINCPGGIVMDGYNIFNAILKSNTPVDTYNIGIAASIAGVIFMAGRKRVMADYASLMIHPPQGGSDRKQLDTISESLVTMLSAKSSLSNTEVKYLMDRTSWLNSAECFAKGFCTDIEITSDSNKKRMPTTTNVMEMWRVANSITNLKENDMSTTKITMRLKLNDSAPENDIIAAIDAIENRAYKAETDLIGANNRISEVENASKIEKEALKKKLEEAENTKAVVNENYNKLKDEYDAMVTDKLTAEKATNELKAKTMVEGYAKVGRIKNEAAVILKWTNLAVEDFAGTEELIKELPLNLKAPVLTEQMANKLEAGAIPTSAVGMLVKNKLKREGKAA